MTARIHEVKLTTDTDRVFTRIIVDTNSIRALRTGLTKMPDDITGPLKIVCTPLCALAEEHITTEASLC
jgi:hypothetical protein